MTPDEYAEEFTASLVIADASSDRTAQSMSGQVGVSDLGWCQEYVRRLIVQAPRTDSPFSMAAVVGNWADKGIKSARELVRPELLLDVPLTVTLPNGAKVPGTADEIDPDEPAVTDYKSKDKRGLAAIRRGTSTRTNRWQRHNYGAAAIQAGLVPEQGLVVRNVWMDRSGREKKPHVEQEPFSWDVVAEASAWLDEVLDAVKHGETARKEPPRHECRDYCPFYTACRRDEVEVGPITNPRLVEAVNLYGEASDQAKDAKAVMDALRDEVEGLTGRTDRYELVSTKVNKGRGHMSVTARRIA